MRAVLFSRTPARNEPITHDAWSVLRFGGLDLCATTIILVSIG